MTLDLDRPGLRMQGTTTFGSQAGGSFTGASTSAADLTVTGPAVATGGAGDDVLVGGPGPSTLAGGAGDDALLGGHGNDTLSGGPGDDTLSMGNGTTEVVDGGEGSQDTLSAADVVGPITVSLDGIANDTAPGQTIGVSGVENLSGSPGPDVLKGNTGFNHIYGLAGNDTIDGAGGGHDVLRGGADDDVITARDTPPLFSDIACGQGTDTAVLDAADLVAGDCETVDRAPAPPGFTAPSFPGGPVQVSAGPGAGAGDVAGATATSRATLSVTTPKQLRQRDLRRGVRLRVSSNQVVAVTAELVASAARVMPRAASVPKDNVVLARTTAKGVRASRTLTLRVAPSLRRGVRRVLVRVTAVNSAGQRTVVQRRLRVR